MVAHLMMLLALLFLALTAINTTRTVTTQQQVLMNTDSLVVQENLVSFTLLHLKVGQHVVHSMIIQRGLHHLIVALLVVLVGQT
jgi:hypothetical protein